MTEEMIEHRKMLMVLSRHMEEDYYKTGALHIKIAAAMEEYAQDKVKNLGLFDVSGSHSTCEHCGGGNVAWGTTDELWSKVADNQKKAICPQCFVGMAESKLDYKSVIVGFNAEVINR